MKKLRIISVLSLVFILFVAGCFNDANHSSEQVDILAGTDTAPTVYPTATPKVLVTATPGQEEPIIYESNTLHFQYYDVAAQKDIEVDYPIAQEEAELVPLYAVSKEVMGGKEIPVNKVIFSDGNVFIDFQPEVYDMELGSAGEVVFLDSIADAYLNNVKGAKAIFFSVDGEAYISEHLDLPKTESYKAK